MLLIWVDSPKQTQKRLRAIMEGTEFAERLTPIFARINSLVTFLQGFKIKRKFFICPLSSLNEKFFRGSILFQCIFDGKRRDVFAAGGRYDSLVQDFRSGVTTNRVQPHAVGFNLSWDRLSSAMIDYVKAPTKASLKHPETDVGAFWKTRRVSGYRRTSYCTVLNDISSVMYLWLALTQQSYARWVCS